MHGDRADTGTLQYDLYFNDDQSECVVTERYRDSESAMEHNAHVAHLVAHLMEAILATGSVSGELLGTPSPEFRAKMADTEVRLFTPYQVDVDRSHDGDPRAGRRPSVGG